MSDLISMLNGSIAQAIGWSLVHLLWQATVIAVVLGLTSRLLRNASSNLRYVLAAGALVLTTMMPFVTGYFVWQKSVHPRLDGTTAYDIAPVAVEVSAATPILVLKNAESGMAGESGTMTIREGLTTLGQSLASALPMIVALWCVGVIILSTRLTISWVRIQSLMRSASIRAEEWNRVAARLSRRLGVHRTIEVFESALVEVPTVIGFVKPVILMPVATLTGLSPEQIETILAHELAHVRRQDYLVNLFQTVVETLFFYHPAVWWISGRIRVEREHCCDDLAVEVCGDPFAYARALTILEQMRITTPDIAVAATGGSLLARVRRLLGLGNVNEPLPSSLVAGSILSTAILITGLVLTPLTTASESDWFDSDYEMTVSGDDWDRGPAFPDDPIDPLSYVDPPEPPDPPELMFLIPAPPLPPAMPAPPLPPMVATGINSIAGMAAMAPMLANWGDTYAGAFEEALAEVEWNLETYDADLEHAWVEMSEHLEHAGVDWEDGTGLGWRSSKGNEPIDFKSLSVDELIAIKNLGITREWVDQMRAEGISDMTFREAVQLKGVGVSPAFAHEMRKAFGDLEAMDLVRMKGVGVTSAFAQQIRDAGIASTDVDDLIRIRSVGVDPSYIVEMRKSLGSDLSIGDVIRLRGVGVTPEYVSAIRASGFEVDTGDVIRLRGVGVTPNDIGAIRAAGFRDTDLGDVVRLKGVGVTPEYMSEMRRVLGDDLGLNDMVRLKGVGVTPAYIQSMTEVGISKLDANDLVRLRGVGVTPEYVREMREMGFDDLDADDLIRLRGNGIDAEFIRDMKKK